MDYHHRRSPGFYAPLFFLLLRLPAVTIAAINPPPQAIELRQTTPTEPNDSPPAATTSLSPSNQDDNNSGMTDEHVFNYYFLLIAIFVAILLLAFVFAGKRRKRKTLALLTSRQEALRRDIESWPGRTRPPVNTLRGSHASRFAGGIRNWGARNGHDAVGVTRHDEGLDESGEAPPPYNPVDKPPSIATGNRMGRGATDEDGGVAVPLRTMSRNNGAHPPGYMEIVSNHGSDESDTIPRPNLAVTADTADGSRRLLDRTEGSSN